MTTQDPTSERPAWLDSAIERLMATELLEDTPAVRERTEEFLLSCFEELYGKGDLSAEDRFGHSRRIYGLTEEFADEMGLELEEGYELSDALVDVEHIIGIDLEAQL